jgi:hypothetical protein
LSSGVKAKSFGGNSFGVILAIIEVMNIIFYFEIRNFNPG